MVIAWIVFRENVDRRLLLGAAAILAGAVLLSWSGEGFHLGWGSILIAGACLAWGIDNNLARKLSASDPVQIAANQALFLCRLQTLLDAGHGQAGAVHIVSQIKPTAQTQGVQHEFEWQVLT